MVVRIEDDGTLVVGNVMLPPAVVPAVEAFFRERLAPESPTDEDREALIEGIASAIHFEDNGATPDAEYVAHDEYDATYRMPAQVAYDFLAARRVSVPPTEDVPALRAEHAEERRQGICRTCLLPIWNEGGTIRRAKRPEGWSDRIERGGDSLVCFKAADYRHVPLTGREACIYDHALALPAPTEEKP